MATHTGRVFLNSCLKVPIDPCNNCPAPIFNRPKMYLGRFSTTPMRSTTTAGTKLNTAATTTATSLKTAEIEADAMWNSTGVRSLAKFYDSIPDYCEINHLPEEEFYSTLDTLKSTCRQLRTKSPHHSSLLDGSSYNSTISSHCGTSKLKKSSKNKTTSSKSGHKKKTKHKQQQQWNHESEHISRCLSETPCSLDAKKQLNESSTKHKCFKEEFADEVEALKKSLKDFEQEFKRPISASIYRPKSTSFATKDKYIEAQFRLEEDLHTKEIVEKVPVKPLTTCLRESMKKSFSFNDLHSLDDSVTNSKHDFVEHSSQTAKPFDKLTRAEILAFKDRTRLSNYFMQKPTSTNENNGPPTVGDIPKIIVESPSSETFSSKLSSASTSRHIGGRKKKSKIKKREEQIQVPFSLFNLTDSKKDLESHSSPSPLHPVARPNLAATLRVEVCKKKVKELQNNCTFHDTTPQFDWEVRKTPAWKSLSLNESHKEILLLRLATRKAEQALQRREYDLNMELMRQRVKSAPLLLEGTTYWGPNVGKLTHACQREGLRHACQGNQLRRNRKKSNSGSRGVGERVETEGRGGEGGGGGSDCGAGGVRMSNRSNTLRMIYASSTANYSRNSHVHGNEKLPSSRKQHRLEEDSGDELSSVDRAYL